MTAESPKFTFFETFTCSMDSIISYVDGQMVEEKFSADLLEKKVLSTLQFYFGNVSSESNPDSLLTTDGKSPSGTWCNVSAPTQSDVAMVRALSCASPAVSCDHTSGSNTGSR